MSRSAICPLPQSYRMGLVSCTSPLHLRTRGARIGSAPIGVDKGPVGVDCAPRRPVAQRGRLISAAGEGDPTSILRGVAGAPSEGQMITAHATRRCGTCFGARAWSNSWARTDRGHGRGGGRGVALDGIGASTTVTWAPLPETLVVRSVRAHMETRETTLTPGPLHPPLVFASMPRQAPWSTRWSDRPPLRRSQGRSRWGRRGRPCRSRPR
jgi:hypothetical protein